MTATIEVKAVSPSNPWVAKTTTIDVELLANAAGRVVVTHGQTAVELTDLCGLEAKIAEKTLITRPRDGILYGDATPKGRRQKAEAGVKIAGRPDHEALYEACAAINARIEEVRRGMWAEFRAEAEAATRAQAPDGHVALTFRRSEADGWIEIWVNAEGRELRSPKIAKQHGRTGWMTPDDYRAAIEALEAEVEPQTVREEAARPVVAVPAAAEEAYRRYDGDAEKAWEAEDEQAWGLIRKYSDAIEGGA